MFNFLKEKVKSVISSISKKLEEAPEEQPVKIEKEALQKKEVSKMAKKEISEAIKEEKIPKKKEFEEKKKEEVKIEEPIQKEEESEKKGFFKKFFGKKEELPKKEKPEEVKEIPIKKTEENPEKNGFFKSISEKITTKKISASEFTDLFWDLELVLLESNVALEVIEKIKDDLKEKMIDQPLKRSEISNIIISSLKESIASLFEIKGLDLISKANEKKPLVICFIGINGSGKTTSIAKVAHLFQKNKKSVVLAAADTFRAAAIQQLEEHANKLGVKIIKHEYGSDSAAVAFDAIKHAEARHNDVVLIDTAGRLHSNKDLMLELKKLIKVAKPDLKLFVGESITGNDCVEQAKEFDTAIGIDGIILSKADIDEKGGAAISISYITKKPILYLGTGQGIDDLKEFKKEDVLKNLGL